MKAAARAVAGLLLTDTSNARSQQEFRYVLVGIFCYPMQGLHAALVRNGGVLPKAWGRGTGTGRGLTNQEEGLEPPRRRHAQRAPLLRLRLLPGFDSPALGLEGGPGGGDIRLPTGGTREAGPTPSEAPAAAAAAAAHALAGSGSLTCKGRGHREVCGKRNPATATTPLPPWLRPSARDCMNAARVALPLAGPASTPHLEPWKQLWKQR